MRLDRRGFLIRLAGGSAGVLITGTSLASNFTRFPFNVMKVNSSEGHLGIFPFFEYVNRYQFGDYFPKDQGGKFVQTQLINSEDDETIVETVRNGLLTEILGDPIDWAKLEKTELEKSVWLNRFYYLPSFARLFYLTKDKTYLEDMMKVIRTWLKDNPPHSENSSSRYNWYDMQVAWRAIHLSWCYFLGYDGLSEEDKTLITGTLQVHADILHKDFGKKELNEFNHQAHGALAMLYLGILFPQLPDSKQLTEVGIRILEHHVEYAFYDDGGNVEQMFGYYPFETCIFRDAYLLCVSNGVKPPKNIRTLLEKMVTYLSYVAQPDNTMPPVNDSYPMPVDTTIATVKEILDYSLKMKETGSMYFPETQVGVMRSGLSKTDDWYLLVNPAKLIGSHAHAGRLGFVAWFGQQPVFVESGCSNYDEPSLVSWYRTSRAHNTVLIDGVQDEATSSNILWAAKRITENRITEWVEKENYRFVQMVSPDTEKTNQSVSWIRSLAFIRNDYMLIYDHFEAEETHDYEILLHLAKVELEADKKNMSFVMKSEMPIGVFPFDASNYSEIKVDKGIISKEARDVLAPLVSYKTSGSEKHSVLLVSPVRNLVAEFELNQEIREDGIVLTIGHQSGRKDTVLFRKADVKTMKYGMVETEEWMTVL